MEKLARRMVEKLYVKKPLTEDQKQVFTYGLTLLMITSLGCCSILMLSAFLFDVMTAVIFLLVFATLRTFSGGFHCNTFFHCFISSNLLFLMCAGSVKGLMHLSLILNVVFTITTALFSAWCVFRFAPVLNQRNPLSPRRIALNRKNARKSARIFSIGILLAVAVNSQNPIIVYYSEIAAFAMLFVSVLILVTLIKERRSQHG